MTKSLFNFLFFLSLVFLATIIVLLVTIMDQGRELKKCNQQSQENYRDYQVSLFNDTVWVYDIDRQVGRYTLDTLNLGKIDSILLEDNL